MQPSQRRLRVKRRFGVLLDHDTPTTELLTIGSPDHCIVRVAVRGACFCLLPPPPEKCACSLASSLHSRVNLLIGSDSLWLPPFLLLPPPNVSPIACHLAHVLISPRSPPGKAQPLTVLHHHIVQSGRDDPMVQLQMDILPLPSLLMSGQSLIPPAVSQR